MDMIKQLQSFMRQSEVYRVLFNTESGQLETRQVSINDLSSQMFIDSATWALAIYEKEFGIITDLSQTYEERRSVIKSRMRGIGTVNKALIKVVAFSFSNGDVDVSISNSTIKVSFTSLVGVPPNEDALKAALEEIKPAHLGMTYEYLYNNWSQIAAKKWADISVYTWEQVMSDGAVVT